jgi:hypothetical protein
MSQPCNKLCCAWPFSDSYFNEMLLCLCGTTYSRREVVCPLCFRQYVNGNFSGDVRAPKDRTPEPPL